MKDDTTRGIPKSNHGSLSFFTLTTPLGVGVVGGRGLELVVAGGGEEFAGTLALLNDSFLASAAAAA